MVEYSKEADIERAVAVFTDMGATRKENNN
jgi:hypothetical protein